MTTLVSPPKAPPPVLHRFSVADYHRMLELGMLTPDDRVELLEGYVVKKRTRHNPAQDGPFHFHGMALHRFSVDDYHRMIEVGILTSGDRVELLEGCVVQKMSQNPPRHTALQRTRKRIEALARTGWEVRIQAPITLPDTEPEPDVAVARGDDSVYATRHPGPADIGLVVEVSDSTLDFDRRDKAEMYARAGVVEYWIVNLVDRQVEVYTRPSGPTPAPAYSQRQVYGTGMSVPLVLDGVTLGQIAVNDLLP
jgi:Uma2 family endonuclease